MGLGFLIILCLLAVEAATAFAQFDQWEYVKLLRKLDPQVLAPRGALPAINKQLRIRFLNNGLVSYLGRYEDDFATFSNFGEEEEEDGKGLAREFHRELEVRGCKKKQDENQKTPKESRFFQISSPPTPRPSTSAGLFSGSGTTVYSSGRSIRAEIEILETTLKNNDAKDSKGETEELRRSLFSFILALLIAYIVSEAMASGGPAIMPGDGAVSSSDHAMSLVLGGMSGITMNVGGDDVFLGEEAAWLLRESSGLAAFVVETVRSVEELVPR